MDRMQQTRKTQTPRRGWLLLAVMFAAIGSTRAGDAIQSTAIPEDATRLLGFTAPSRTVALATAQVGRIVTLPVDEGDHVDAGDIVIGLDDSVQRKRTDLARAAAESTLAVELAQVRLRQARNELERVQALTPQAAVSEKELNDALANAEAAALSVAQARFQHAQAVRQFALQQALLDEHQVRAPFAGYVAERLHDLGDMVEDRETILTLVQLDPLEVTFDCPLEFAHGLDVGKQVRFEARHVGRETRLGEIVFVSRVADAASQTLKVRARVPNPDGGWIGGMQVTVDLREPPLTSNVDLSSTKDNAESDPSAKQEHGS